MGKMVNFKSNNKWEKTRKYLQNNTKLAMDSLLNKYGQLGVIALQQATPKDTGLTANSWYYEIDHPSDGVTTLTWCNSNMAKDAIPIALLLQYGHATRNGGYVQGVDYINPALKSVFDSMAESLLKEVIKN